MSAILAEVGGHKRRAAVSADRLSFHTLKDIGFDLGRAWPHLLG
jgi:hypothetical protein